ncbi:putative 26S proteasome complex subunit sem-1 [Zostera marina]|uniref:26S proteasome complex subunit SEM1 n=1 Tax=Zostera marina TaxID=29655 RepID=A0A0K9PLB2_ZOSMR|nr:putative 26S proteasome complex subunit sem-1 [Zostera marina]
MVPEKMTSEIQPKEAPIEAKATSTEVKVDLFEDDDEFEEFDIDIEWDDKEESKDALQQWENDWDDDDVNDDFSVQLKKELESNNNEMK